MPRFDAVLFDFSDTLFWRDGCTRIGALAAQCGVDLEGDPRPLRLWAEVRARSVSASELAKHRDSSAEAHRHCWTDLYRPFDAFAPDANHPFRSASTTIRQILMDGAVLGHGPGPMRACKSGHTYRGRY